MRSLVASWRTAIVEDVTLDRTASHVALVLSTYMDARGHAFPSKALLARGAGLAYKGTRGGRGIDLAVDRLEAAGYLRIERSKGRRSFRYFATVPTAHGDAPLFEANVARDGSQRRTARHSTSHGGATESVERFESRDGSAFKSAPSAVDGCMRCLEVKPLYEVGDRLLCGGCTERELA